MDSPASDRWFYSSDRSTVHQATWGKLQQLVLLGKLHPNDLVWHTGMNDWVEARTIKGLFPPGYSGTGISDSTASPVHVTTYSPTRVPADAVSLAPMARPLIPGADDSAVIPLGSDAYPRGIAYASLLDRFLAWIIDLVVYYGMALVFSGAFLLWDLVIPTSVQSPIVWAMLQDAAWLLAYLGVVWLYHALMESSTFQATLGKLALGIAVTDLHGRRVTFLRATGRCFVKYWAIAVPIMLICFSLAVWMVTDEPVYWVVGKNTIGFSRVLAVLFFAGCVIAAFTQKKQALHDIVAGTLVVRRSYKKTVA
jgi:uncharacterized RDD family membrane protein YckC